MNFTLRRQECQSTKNKQTKTKNMTTDEQNTLLKENCDKNPAHSTMGGNWIGMYMSMGGLAISYIRWQFKQLGKTNLEAYSAICWFVLVCVTFSKWNLYYVWTQIKCAFGNELLNKIFVSIKRQCLMVNTHYSNKCSQT